MSTSSAVIDDSALEMLRELSPEDPVGFVQKIVAVFLQQSATDQRDLDAAVASGKSDVVQKMAHKTKSGARSVGAMILGDAAEALETAAKSGATAESLREPIAAFRAAYAAADAELRKITGLS